MVRSISDLDGRFDDEWEHQGVLNRRDVALKAAVESHRAATPLEIIEIAAFFETYLQHGHVPETGEGGAR